MTQPETEALRRFLIEQRRHYLALAKSCEVYLNSLSKEPEKGYNNSGNGKGVTVTPKPEFDLKQS